MSTASGTGERPRVFLHVGSPKTGTTFLQNVLWAQRDLAREQGLLLPMERFNDHYLGTLDLRGLSGRPVYPERAVGMWDRLVEESLGWSGSVLISHELFAAATAEQAQRGVASLAERGAEVHLVVTVRDLVRQLTAEWQEHVKHRSTKTFPEFVAGLRDDTERGSWFWRVQDFSGVVSRWGADLPPEHVHVVTVPPSGSPAGLLWERFATLLGLDPASFDTTGSRANSSLGVEQAELLRRVNLQLGERLPLPGPYPTVVKNVLAHRVLEPRAGTRLRLNAEDTAYAVAESRAIAERLAAAAVDVVGDLAELVPAQAAGATEGRTSYPVPEPDALLDESIAAIADLLVVLNERRAQQRRAEDLVATARQKPVRFALVHASERRPLLMRLRRAKRALTGGRGRG
jgi:hypothetical protein